MEPQLIVPWTGVIFTVIAAAFTLVWRHQNMQRYRIRLEMIQKERLVAMEKGIPMPELPDYDDGGTLAVRIGGKSLPAVAVGEDRFYVKGGGQLETFVIVRDAKGVPRFLCAETWALRKRS